MRVVYRDLRGVRRVKEFQSFADLCVWLKRWYPLLKAAEEIGDFVRLV